jgi:long-chain acyl-CoA synthetase
VGRQLAVVRDRRIDAKLDAKTTRSAVEDRPNMGMTRQEAIARLTGPGAPFEFKEREIRGVRVRTWDTAPANLREILLASRDYGDRDFLVYEDERLSYAAHYDLVCRFAWVLQHRFRVQKGERVAIAMRNFPEWSIAFWAAASIGAVVVPLNAWWSGSELDYGLGDSGACVAIVDHERYHRVTGYLDGLNLRAVVVVRADGAPSAAKAIGWDMAMAEAPEDAPLTDRPIDPEDDATIFYTSGTTGFPKGALGTQRNICTNVATIGFRAASGALRRGVTPAVLGGDKVFGGVLLSVPFFHATGCHSILCPAVMNGSKLVLMYRWSPEQALALIEREKLTSFGGVPGMVWQVMESPDFAKRDTSSVTSIGYGGAPAASELVRRITELFPAAEPGNGYGLTETSSVTTQNAGEDYRRKPDSVGSPMPVCEVKVVDDSGAEVPRGEVGEIWIKGPNVVKGYWNKPEATAATFSDGWLHTGDLGRMDEEDFVYVLDRAKDMLIRGGENVYCVEVEDALYSHPAVMDAAVIGRPHHILGEEVCAVVQVAPGQVVDEAALIAHCRDCIAAFKVPVMIDIRHEPLPRNANGKIVKHVLKDELFADGAPAA